jgi:hypothetical protein
MAQNTRDMFIITQGRWMHLRVVRIHHRHFPEVRGEGRSLREAARHLARLLAQGIDCAHGPRREALERAVADARALLPASSQLPRPPVAVTS